MEVYLLEDADGNVKLMELWVFHNRLWNLQGWLPASENLLVNELRDRFIAHDHRIVGVAVAPSATVICDAFSNR